MPRFAMNLAVLASLVSLSLAGCPAPEPVDPPDAGPPSWRVVLGQEALDRALLSIWGTGPGDVFAVGGPLGNDGFESLAIHFDGKGWRDLKPGGAETYWWVAGSGPKDVWMVGEKGRISRYDGAGFTEHESGTTATLWGVIAFSPTDAWAVGGTPEGGVGPANDVVLRWDGSAWHPVPLPGEPLGRSLYKVWGESSDDLYIVGEHGTIWHRLGESFALESDPPLAKGTLFTVAGCGAGEVYAVGGYDVLRSEGAGWTAVDVDLSNGVNGVSCASPGEVAIVGFGGSKQRLADGTWVDEFTVEPYDDLHAVWADGAGNYWAVGGDFLTKPSPGAPRRGVVARFGAGDVAGAPLR